MVEFTSQGFPKEIPGPLRLIREQMRSSEADVERTAFDNVASLESQVVVVRDQLRSRRYDDGSNQVGDVRLAALRQHVCEHPYANLGRGRSPMPDGGGQQAFAITEMVLNNRVVALPGRFRHLSQRYRGDTTLGKKTLRRENNTFTSRRPKRVAGPRELFRRRGRWTPPGGPGDSGIGHRMTIRSSGAPRQSDIRYGRL